VKNGRFNHSETFFLTFSIRKARKALFFYRLPSGPECVKYTYDLSDEGVVSKWFGNPCWPYLSAMQWFAHEVPVHPSSMTRWRKRIGEASAEALLKATIAAGLKLKALKAFQLKRVNVDTMVQEKEIRFPTDARLNNRAGERLVKAAGDRGIVLRQNYNRKANRQFAQQSRYAVPGR